MPRVFLDSNLKSMSTEDFRAYVETLFHQLEDQINAGTHVASVTDGNNAVPTGMERGDVVFSLERGELKAGIYNGKSITFASFGSFTGAITDAQHGPRAGGNLHPVATTTVAGFQSAGDKNKADQFKGDTSSALPPSLTEYPTAGDWGFHTDTNLATYHLARNKGGTIYKTLLT